MGASGVTSMLAAGQSSRDAAKPRARIGGSGSVTATNGEQSFLHEIVAVDMTS